MNHKNTYCNVTVVLPAVCNQQLTAFWDAAVIVFIEEETVCVKFTQQRNRSHNQIKTLPTANKPQNFSIFCKMHCHKKAQSMTKLHFCGLNSVLQSKHQKKKHTDVRGLN